RSLPLLKAREVPMNTPWTLEAKKVETIAKPGPVNSIELDRYKLAPNDVVIAGILDPRAPRVAMLSAKNAPDLYVHSSVLRIRITDPSVSPEDVVRYLRSELGIQALARSAAFVGRYIRVTARDLVKLAIMV